LWPRHYFLVFPRNLRSLEFEEGNDRPPIPARTGPDPDDRESGGQPVSLSVAFQYQLQKRSVPNIYQTYGLAWEASYLRFAQQAITNVAQQYEPKQFWNHRRQIELAAARFGECQTDQTPAETGHEVDRLGRHEIGREHQVAFVFAVFLVDQNDHPAGSQFGNDLAGGGNRVAVGRRRR
jgi:hypothetical protein